MKNLTALLLATALVVSLPACSTVKKFTGQQDDSILPGTREDILPPDQQTARDPVVTGQQKPAGAQADAPTDCDPDDTDCVLPPVDQEATSTQ